ncbi:aryl-alcohol dehydrogenase (NADP+) [Thiohalospira halophila DSM 15071]|uniref:Protein tas n=1 Tax=Thiohalospira halophila DSM 15071 TaxID=1123397 RepID=A0A1I1W5H1_9GAMM|nr:NADP(H)-dependent aldo-keto reductase [Thiohalospira halophila]SFD88200.1 aryl-alcohol dehydrogenase (NADP+) [Thiohalospira halophila DSM 15071]
MRYNRLGTSDLEVSEIGLGTMTFGDQNSEAEAHEQLDYALERGINLVDTAELYPVPPKAETHTRTEQYIGNWLAAEPARRDRIILATKVTGRSRVLPWMRGDQGELPRVDRSNIERAIEGSLRRLRTDHVDLYQIHWPERNVPKFGEPRFDPHREWEATPIREQLEVLKGLVDAGKVRYIGLSNETPWGVAEFTRLADEHGLPRVVSIQNAYNLINRSFEHGLDEVAWRQGVPLLAYSPLAFGHLTGKYLDGGAPAGARLTVYPEFGNRYAKPGVPEACREYVELAREAGLDPAQMALAFVRQQFFTASTLVGATSMEQLKADIDSVDITLSDDLLTRIDAIHRRWTNPAL